MIKDFVLTRIVSRDIATDMFQGLRNFFGLRLRGYENRINLNVLQMLEEMRWKYKKIKWYRIDTEKFTSSSCMINIYGEYDE